MIIYKATNKINNKVYIGQTIKALEERIQQHIKSSKNPKSKFHKALKKWSVDCFDWIILEQNIDTKAHLDVLELQYQYRYKAVEEGYNMVYMAGGGYNQKAVEINKTKKGKTWNEIYTTIGLQSMIHKVIPSLMRSGHNYRFDKIDKQLQKEYASRGGKSHKGKKESRETCLKISKGLRNSEKFQKMKQDPEYKKQRSVDAKLNWNNPNSVYNTPEYREKLRQARIERFKRDYEVVKPKLINLLNGDYKKKDICKMLNVSYPTLQKYISLL
jgi:group I intron endonuclease